MFAEKTELMLIEDLNETALVELNAADVEDVSGAAIPFAVWAVGYYAVVHGPKIAKGAAVIGAGVGSGYASYRLNRR